jgi:type II secretory pathway pseudopilin PulG
MHRLKDERGMTLVVVLLTITIFSVLGLAVVGASMNNTKQVQKTEVDIQTTDIAEMGVQHYQNMLLNFFHEQIAAKRESYKQLIITKFNQTGNVPDDYIETLEQQLAGELIGAYNNQSTSPLKSTVSVTVQDQTLSSYKIEKTGSTILCKECDISKEKKLIEVSYKSNSYKNSQLEKQLAATFAFSFYINKDGIQTEALPVDYESIISEPTDVVLCNEEDLKKKTGSDAIGKTDSNGQVEFDSFLCKYDDPVLVEKPNSIKNSKLVFNNGVTFNQVMNKGILSSTLYINGDLILNKHINGIESSEIFVKGTKDGWSKFETLNQGIHNSTIVIIGNVLFGDNNDKFKDLEHSSIYVKGTANFTNMSFSNFSDTSKICIDGNAIGTIDMTLPIYIKSLNEDLFLQKCTLDQSIEVTDQFLDWDESVDPIVDYSN